MAKLDAGSRESEFGGYPGQFSDVDHGQPLSPSQERQSYTETNSADPNSSPAYGTGGKRVV